MDTSENIESPVGGEGATSSPETDSQVTTQPSETEEVVSDDKLVEEVALLAGKYETPEELEKGYKELESKLGERSEHSELTKMLEEQTGMSASQIRDYISRQNELKLQQQYAQNPTPILAREIQQLKSQLALQAEEKELDKFLEKNPEYSNFKEEIQEYAFMPKYQGMSYADIARDKIGKIIARGQETAYKKIETKKQTQATGVSQAPPKGKLTLEDMRTMSTEELRSVLPHAQTRFLKFMTMVVAGPANSTTATLTAEMALYYEKVFLDRLVQEQVYNFLAVNKTVPKNSGKSVAFTRQTAFSINTVALTEGTNPTGTPFSSTMISATLAEYGDFDAISSLFELTSIDDKLEEKVATMGQYGGEKMDTVLLTAMVGSGTRQYAGAGGLTGVGSTDVMTVAELRKAVKTLKINKAPKFEAPVGKITGGAYRSVIDSYAWYNLMGDSAVGNFVSVNQYASAEGVAQIKNQEIKRLAGCDCIESNNVASLATLGASSTDTGYISFVAGKGAVAEVDIAGSGNVEIIHEPASSGGVSNPLHMYGTIGWKVNGYVARVLNANWLIEIVTRP